MIITLKIFQWKIIQIYRTANKLWKQVLGSSIQWISKSYLLMIILYYNLHLFYDLKYFQIRDIWFVIFPLREIELKQLYNCLNTSSILNTLKILKRKLFKQEQIFMFKIFLFVCTFFVDCILYNKETQNKTLILISIKQAIDKQRDSLPK